MADNESGTKQGDLKQTLDALRAGQVKTQHAAQKELRSAQFESAKTRVRELQSQQCWTERVPYCVKEAVDARIIKVKKILT